MNKRGGCERFTDFSSGLVSLGLIYPPSFLPAVFMAGWRVYPPSFWRTVFGKSDCWERNANQSLSVTKAKAFHFVFPGIFTDLTKAKRRADPYTFTISQKPSVDLTPLLFSVIY